MKKKYLFIVITLVACLVFSVYCVTSYNIQKEAEMKEQEKLLNVVAEWRYLQNYYADAMMVKNNDFATYTVELLEYSKDSNCIHLIAYSSPNSFTYGNTEYYIELDDNFELKGSFIKEYYNNGLNVNGLENTIHSSSTFEKLSSTKLNDEQLKEFNKKLNDIEKTDYYLKIDNILGGEKYRTKIDVAEKLKEKLEDLNFNYTKGNSMGGTYYGVYDYFEFFFDDQTSLVIFKVENYDTDIEESNLVIRGCSNRGYCEKRLRPSFEVTFVKNNIFDYNIAYSKGYNENFTGKAKEALEILNEIINQYK